MDEAMLKSGQYPNVAIEAGTDPAEVMREHGRADKADVDSRERLEADIATLYAIGTPSENAVLGWLDRQAMITERLMAKNWEETSSQLVFDMNEARAERDRLQKRNDRQGETIDRLSANYDELRDEHDSLLDERDQLSRDIEAEHALVVQFEHDNEELRDTCNTLRASVAGLKMTVEKLRSYETA